MKRGNFESRPWCVLLVATLLIEPACGSGRNASLFGPASGSGSAGAASSVAGAAGSREDEDGSAGEVGALAGTGGEPSDQPSDGQGGEGAPHVASECPCSAPKPTCVSNKCVVRGPSMVKVGSFYVDSTEVTVQQYQAFLAAKGDDLSGQAAACSWNDSFAPAGRQQAAMYPVTDLDFCDAAAFCAWADKQLCGKIGGGQLLIDELPFSSKSQWVAACGGPNGHQFPYGTAHIDGACNDASGAHAIAQVASFPDCEGSYRGLHDMVGNVAEWVDACDASLGALDGCETIGGSFATDLACTGSGLRHRNQHEPTLGFRCCSE